MSNTHTPRDNGQSLNNGQVYIANENRFQNSHYSEPLTAFTVGWKDNDPLVELLDFIAPPVEVARRFEFKRADESQCFLSEIDDIRAEGAAFKRVEYTGSSVNEKTLNKGLTIRVDHDDVAGDSWHERYVQILMQRLYRSELRRSLAALLSLDPVGQALIWSSNPTASPDSDVLAAILAVGNASGVEPTRALFGRGAWQLRHQHYATNDKAAAFAGLLLSPSDLAIHYGLEAVRVAKERLDGPDGKALANYAVLFNAQQVLDKDDPSNLKRFITPTEQGAFRVFLEEHAKFTDISVEHYSNIVTTSTLGVQKLIIS
jgi:hypothetical protein